MPQPNTIFLLWKRISGGTTYNFGVSGYSLQGRNDISSSAGNIYGYSGTILPYSKTVPFDFTLTTGVFNGANTQIYDNGLLKVTGNAGTLPLDGITVGAMAGG